MAEKTSTSVKNPQVMHQNFPTLDREQRYAQAFDLDEGPAVTASPVQFPTGMQLTDFVLHSIAPTQSPAGLAADVQAFTQSVKDVIAAVNEKVISPEEGDAVIGLLAEKFAARRANSVLSRTVAFQPY